MPYCHLHVAWYIHAIDMHINIYVNMHQQACACKLLLFAYIRLHLHNTSASVLHVRMYVCMSIWSCSSWSHHHPRNITRYIRHHISGRYVQACKKGYTQTDAHTHTHKQWRARCRHAPLSLLLRRCGLKIDCFYVCWGASGLHNRQHLLAQNQT